MSWSREIRNLLMTVFAVQFVSIFFLMTANKYALSKKNYLRRIETLYKYTIAEDLQKLDDFAGFHPKLYLRNTWYNVLGPLEQERLRKRICDVFGLNNQVIEMAPDSMRIFVLQEEWSLFKNSYRKELISSAKALDKYLKNESIEALKEIKPIPTERLIHMPYLIRKLKELAADCGNFVASQPQERGEILSIYEATADLLPELVQLIAYYSTLVEGVAQLALANGHTQDENFLWNGNAPVFDISIKQPESVEVLGFPIKSNLWGRILLVVLLVLLTSIYFRVLWIGREEVLTMKLSVKEGWFALALPTWLRYIVICLLPIILLIAIIIMALSPFLSTAI